jgi:hypothetical protein
MALAAANAPRARSIWSPRSKAKVKPRSAAASRSRLRPARPASACGSRPGRAAASRPRLPAPRRPALRRRARRPHCAARSRHRRRAPSPGRADQGRARQARSSRACPLRGRKNPAAPTPGVAAPRRAPQALRQNRSRPRSDSLAQTLHARPPSPARRTTRRRPRHGRARRDWARLRRWPPRSARCVHAKSQACLCVRSSCAASLET